MFPLSQCHPPFTPKTLEHAFPPLPHRTLCFQKPYPPKASKNPKTLSKTAIQRITEKLQSLGYISHDPIESQKPEVDLGSPGEIFISRQLPARRVGHTIDDSWTSPDNPVPHPGAGPAIKQFHEIRRDLEKQKRKEKELTGRGKRVPPSVAELTIPEAELKRLRSVGIRLEKRVKVGKAGITEGIVNGIHERWRRSELVKIKCEDLCRMNMKRTHEILEMKTGGLVVWRSGSIIILYRGPNYKYPYFFSETKRQDGIDELSSELSNSDEDDSEDEESQTWTSSTSSSELISSNKLAPPSLVIGVGSPKKVRFQLPGEAQLEEEADRMLDGLGPRFSDWWGYNPLPIDADLLPAFIHGYRRPFRLLPYGVNPKLTGPEMTTLRRLGRPLPCHFALGRNKNLQGLAVAIIKLWEKCEIAKIAVKRGVQNTNSELMAEELKWLTGGTLLSRDREFIVFYRGKDFLPPAVSVAMEERRKNLTYAEKQRTDKNLSVVTIHEQLPVDSPSMDQQREARDEKKIHTKEERKLRSTSLSVKSMAAKLSLVQERKVKAEKLLEKLEKAAEAKSPDVDKEGISEEERYMLRKVGLRMNAFLLLGRRGVFDGIVENMHLHWKYRELVKIISKDRSVEEVRRAAEILEVESGGILVAVERVNKGHAIIVYRGKNYERPTNLRPKTLLNKREAMKRSLEMQRRESLKLHVLKLTSDMDMLTLKLGNDAAMARSNGDIGTHDPYDMVEYAQGDGKVLNEQKTEASSLQPIRSDGVSSDCEVTFHTTLVKKESHSQLQDSFPKYIDESAAAERVLLDEVESRSDLNSAAHPTHLLQQGGSHDDVPAIELRESPYKLVGGKPDSPLHRKVEEFDAEIPFRAAPLSNRERLLLRKQALKMKKRPVLAIGRNNVVTGVAKTIKAHFRRNPLAIVNVKGRANGTSIQELVFKLEQATGAVLVSQEPNKVILYRGWGEGDKPACPKNGREATKPFTGGMPPTLDSVSPELMAAIRFECGLQTRTEEHISGSE